MVKHLLVLLGAAFLAGGIALALLASVRPPQDAASGTLAPEFPSLAAKDWSGTPTSLASLRGRPVLLNVWTFGCYNCARTLPWVRAMHARYGPRGLAVIGVHSPEFDSERDPSALAAAREKHHLDYPSYIDNGYVYWRSLGNRYWPTIYILDSEGRIRTVQVGEVHEGDEADRALGSLIESLLPPKP